MLKNDNKPVSRKSNIVVQDFGNEILIYDLTENKAFNLNETSAMVWQLCDGNKTVSDIAGNLSGRFDSPISADFVWFALEQLKKDNLLENASEVSIDFGGLSRREVVSKVGFATLVALPMISSLIAPMAIHAQSNCGASSDRPNGCPCTTQAQCATRCCSSTPRTCVTPGTKASGTPCIANCECASTMCAGSPQRCT